MDGEVGKQSGFVFEFKLLVAILCKDMVGKTVRWDTWKKGIGYCCFLAFIGMAISGCVSYSPVYSDKILLNQMGFYPEGQKIAIVSGVSEGVFFLVEVKSGQVVFRGELSEKRITPFSGRTTQVADFSSFTKEGEYQLRLSGLGMSYPFQISANVHHELAIAALKSYYFQRASMILNEKYAGQWARNAGHADTTIFVHPSAVSSGRPAGSVIHSPGGWYDAGDYNKYVVNSGITLGTLLALWEDYPGFCKKMTTNIPQSNNGIPDLLDEVLWNLRWMLTMQDPADGGVYHKLTNTDFDGMIMPEYAGKPRYVVQKSTAATLDFTAVMAQSARVFLSFGNELPGLADSCRLAAEKSWEWAVRNPAVVYSQKKMNKEFDPDIKTGTYEDMNLTDEWIWAGTELYRLTGEVSFLEKSRVNFQYPIPLPSWSQVAALAYYSLNRDQRKLPMEVEKMREEARHNIVQLADKLLEGVDKQPFAVVMGRRAGDFVWGSNAVAANQGVALLQAYQISRHKNYLNAAMGNLDYLLGRNATGYSFVTGFGTKRVLHPHHRISVADGVYPPVPGLLSGGPNPGQQDKCTSYPSRYPDESYTDDAQSYASNEVAINWNAPLVYLTVAMEAEFQKNIRGQ